MKGEGKIGDFQPKGRRISETARDISKLKQRYKAY